MRNEGSAERNPTPTVRLAESEADMHAHDCNISVAAAQVMQQQIAGLEASQIATSAILAANATNMQQLATQIAANATNNQQLATQVAAVISHQGKQDDKIGVLTTAVTAVASAVHALANRQQHADEQRDQRDLELRLQMEGFALRAIEAESRERRVRRWSDFVATRRGAAARNDTPFHIYGQKRVGGVHHAGQDFVIGPNELYADNIMYHGIHYEFWWYVEPDQAGDPPSWRNGGYISSKSVLIFTGSEKGEVTMTKN